MRHLSIEERQKRNKKILELYQYDVLQKRIAERFGICQKNVSKILEGMVK